MDFAVLVIPDDGNNHEVPRLYAITLDGAKFFPQQFLSMCGRHCFNLELNVD